MRHDSPVFIELVVVAEYLPATAKNVITVGAHQNRYGGAPDAMYPYSSEGPTDDGRINRTS